MTSVVWIRSVNAFMIRSVFVSADTHPDRIVTRAQGLARELLLVIRSQRLLEGRVAARV